MATIDGAAIKRTVLAANAETIIVFSNPIHDLSIIADGGTVYFKVNGTITDSTDMSANYVKDGVSMELYKAQQIKELHCYVTSTNVTLQWDIP